MNTPAPYQADGNGGRRLAASQAPPLSYRRVPVRALRALPIRHNARLEILSYELTRAPGMAGRPRSHGHGSARIAGFVLSLCLVREDGGWFLETESRCYDEQAARRETVVWNDQLLAALYRAVEQKHLAGEARAYGRRAGRN